MIILMVIIMMLMVMIYYFDGYDVDAACYDVDGDGYYVVDAAVHYDVEDEDDDDYYG
jgi:hypothetical protein